MVKKGVCFYLCLIPLNETATNRLCSFFVAMCVTEGESVCLLFSLLVMCLSLGQASWCVVGSCYEAVAVEFGGGEESQGPLLLLLWRRSWQSP